MTRRIFMTGFLVVLARGSFAQIVVCQGVSMVALTMLKTRSPFLRGNDNFVAEAMYTQIIITLLLCVLVKSSAEIGDEGELGRGTVDALMVSAQVLFVPLLLYKRWQKKWRKGKTRKKLATALESVRVWGGSEGGEAGGGGGGGLATIVPVGGESGASPEGVGDGALGGASGTLREQLVLALARADELQEEVGTLRRRVQQQ
jgi:hypothetical protein